VDPKIFLKNKRHSYFVGDYYLAVDAHTAVLEAEKAGFEKGKKVKQIKAKIKDDKPADVYDLQIQFTTDKGSDDFKKYFKCNNQKVGKVRCEIRNGLDNNWTRKRLVSPVVGMHNVGKTWLINHLCQSKLPSAYYESTRGICCKISTDNYLFIDTAGVRGPFEVVQNLAEQAEYRNALDKFLTSVVVDLADIVIVVVQHFSGDDLLYLDRIRKSYLLKKNTNRRILVIHNYQAIENIDEILATFRTKVEKYLHCEYRKIFGNTGSDYYCYVSSISKDKDNPIILHHIIFGREGSPAGNKYNEMGMNLIRNILSQESVIDVINTEWDFKNELKNAFNRYTKKLAYDGTFDIEFQNEQEEEDSDDEDTENVKHNKELYEKENED